MEKKLTKPQQSVYDKILNARHIEHTNTVETRLLNNGLIRGMFNVATLKCLERKGLIRIVNFGKGRWAKHDVKLIR